MLSFDLVIPVLNQARFIPWALESLRCQEVPLAVGVCDGGSRDGLPQALAPYREGLAFYRPGPDAGQAAAIGEGVARLAGDVVGWLNADDYLFPGALRRVAHIFEAHPEVDVVYGDAVHVTEAGLFLAYFPAVRPFDGRFLTKSCFICQPACFVRRAAWERVGGVDPRLHYTMDWDLWCRLARAGCRFHYLRDVLAAVRTYPATKTQAGRGARYREIWRIERRYGRRLLPLAWPGTLWYQLGMQPERKAGAKVLLGALSGLRILKKRARRGGRSGAGGTLYGFEPWSSWVQGPARIALPWYDPRPWRSLRMRVDPADSLYRVDVSGQAFDVAAVKGILTLRPPPVMGCQRALRVACVTAVRWKLLEFWCDFQ